MELLNKQNRNSINISNHCQ